MNIHFNKKTNVVHWTPVPGVDRYVAKMEGGITPDDWAKSYSFPASDTGMDLGQTACWGNIKEAGAEITILARDASSAELESATINVTIPKPPWYSGTAVKLFMLLAVLLGAWAAYSQYKLGKANDVGQRLSTAETLVVEKLTIISNLTSKLAIATNQPKVTNYVTATKVIRVEQHIPVYDIPQGMPKAGPAESLKLEVGNNTNQCKMVVFVAPGNGAEFTTPNNWTVNCLVYANEADFDRLVNIGGITNPQWVYYGPGDRLPPNTRVVSYWIRNKVKSNNLQVEFVLTPAVTTVK